MKRRKTGGRAKGTPNNRRAEQARLIEESGLAPLAFLLAVYRDELIDRAGKPVPCPLSVRVEAAGKAAPYVHQKQPQAINAKLEGSVGLVLNIILSCALAHDAARLTAMTAMTACSTAATSSGVPVD